MSILQVVGSSRISNTIYVAISSIYWTWFLALTGWTLDISIETALLVLSPAAGIAAFLWAIKFEERFVIWFLKSLLVRGYNGQTIRYHIGRTILFLKVWQSSMDFDITINQIEEQEVRRVLKSQLLKDDVNELYQLYWLVFSFLPLSYFLLSIFHQPLESTILLFSVLSIVFILITIQRKRDFSDRVLDLAFCNWLIEAVQTDERRRGNFPWYRKITSIHQPQFREMMKNWTEELLQLANKGDWDGFLKNSASFLNMLETHHHEQKSEKEIDYLIGDVLWYFKLESQYGPAPANQTIPFSRAVPGIVFASTKKMVLDALEEITAFYNWKSKWKEEFWIEVAEFVNKWGKLTHWADLYRIISKEEAEMISFENIKELATLPYLYGRRESDVKNMCQFTSDDRSVWLTQLGRCLFYAVDKDLIDASVVYRTMTRWEISPREYFDATSARVWKIMFEEYVGLPSSDIFFIFQSRFNKAARLDTKKVAANIRKYKESPEFQRLLSFLDSHARKPKRFELAREILIELGVWPEEENGK